MATVLDFTCIAIYKEEDGANGKKIYQCLMTLSRHGKRIVKILQLNTNDMTITSCSYDHTIRIWDLIEHICIVKLKGHHGIVTMMIKLYCNADYLII